MYGFHGLFSGDVCQGGRALARWRLTGHQDDVCSVPVSGRLQVNHGQALPSRPLSVVYLPDRYRSPKLRSFVDFLVERFS